MSAEHVITRKAEDGTLTIAELREFLGEFDATPAQSLAEAGLGKDGLKVFARVNFSGGLKSITVTIPGGDEQQGES